MPSFTFFATAGAVWNAGLRPVFCDVDPDTFTVTAETLEAVWTERTVAAVPVHLFGQMAPMAEIREFAARCGVFVLEDTAQSIGARSQLGAAGAVCDAGALSFFPTKNLGGFGDGGMIITNDPDFAERLRKDRVHGGRKMYHHETVGTNSRLDALHATKSSWTQVIAGGSGDLELTTQGANVSSRMGTAGVTTIQCEDAAGVKKIGFFGVVPA